MTIHINLLDRIVKIGVCLDSYAESSAISSELYEFEMKHFVMSENIKSSVEHGDPAEEIINYAQTEKIYMIIMGTHGRKGLNVIDCDCAVAEEFTCSEFQIGQQFLRKLINDCVDEDLR